MMNGERCKIKRMCIITDAYPSSERAENTFVDQLVCEFADMGIECVVISPQSLTKILLKGIKKLPYYRERITLKGSIVKVYSPLFVSTSAYKKGIINTAVITLKTSINAIDRTFNKLNCNSKFDVIYGHFIFTAGIASDYLSKKYKIPAFFAYGENTNYTIDRLGPDKTRELLSSIKGVISVSTANAENLIKQNIVRKEIIGIFPNSINKNVFYPRDKKEMRKKYGLPEDAFIVVFVGRFVQIKGPDRLSKAIEKIGVDKVKSIFIGSGSLNPTCEGILMKGTQSHEKVPELLSASDVFVLPTMAEGCCNAIIEAMACGLPIISSDLPFNDDILDETCSIRIDTTNIDSIASAIEKLMDCNELRNSLSIGALSKAKELSIEKRAENIINFMELKI